MVSGRLSGWGTARITSYRRLDASFLDRECAPRSTCTFPPALGRERGVHAGQSPPPAPRAPRPAPRPHSRVLQAVRRAQHPLRRHQEAAAHVLAAHLHRRHVGPLVRLCLAAAQDPPTGLRRWGRQRGEGFRAVAAQPSDAPCSPQASPAPHTWNSILGILSPPPPQSLKSGVRGGMPEGTDNREWWGLGQFSPYTLT